ncbi:MAG: 2-phospho-L-lactate transferase [Anaerolineales bacterium]
MRIVVLSGGVGGAKFADGLARAMPAEDLTVIVNTGDDFEHLGLRISPDLDTVVYTLAGLANPETGWGRADESWSFFETLGTLGGPTWFRVGDRDLALHIERTRRLRAGEPLSRVTRDLARRMGVGTAVLPMSEDPTPTIVLTEEGPLPFQEYFVARGWEPRVKGFRFEGMDRARPAPGVLQAIDYAQAVLLGPSNPWVSLDPILAVPGIREAMVGKRVAAVSPIVGGRALKGPAAKMFAELGVPPSAAAIARHFRGTLTDFVLDDVDRESEEEIHGLGMKVWIADTVMRSVEARTRLAGEVLGFLGQPVPERGAV